MRKWIDLLSEAIEPTDYGYWIDPKGKITPVPNQSHAEVMAELTGMESEQAMQVGWVRVIAYCDWLATAFRGRLTPAAARAIKRLAGQGYRNYTLDWQYWDKGRRGDRLETPDRLAFLAGVDKMTGEKPPVNEARMTDGCWTGLTTRQLCDLTRKHDLRGVGFDNEIFLWPAEQAVHMRKRSELGIPSWAGFNFYTATSAVAWEYEDEADDNTLNGRADWVADGARPTFEINDICVYVEQDSRRDCLDNRQFAKLVGHKNDLTEAAIPETTYGYWITAEGQIITVSQDGSHYPIVRKHFGEDCAPDEYLTAMRAGWIRIAGIYDSDGEDIEMCADTYGASTSPRAIRQLTKIAKSKPFVRFFHCDDCAHVEDFFATLPQFMRSVAQATSQSR